MSLNKLLIGLAGVVAVVVGVILLTGGDDGGAGGSEDPLQVLKETFENDSEVTSAEIDLSISGSAEGDQGGEFSASLSGPVQGDPDDKTAFPQLDLTAELSGEGAGQNIDFSGGVIVTGDNAFVEYNDQAYEVGSKAFGEFKKSYEAQAAKGEALSSGNPGQFFKDANVDPTAWLTNLTNEGTEDVNGDDAIKISGDADIAALAEDLPKLAESVPGADQAPIDTSQLNQVEDAIQEASIEVFSGAEDRILRGITVNLVIEPEGSAVDSLDLTFSLRLSGINEDFSIEAPSDAKPIAELSQQLGGLGGLGGFSGSSSGSSSSSSGSANEEYLQCVRDAKQPDEINACADKL